MSSHSQTRSSLSEKIASSDLEDQIAHMSVRPSAWLRAPAPIRFVREQKADIKEQHILSNVSSKNMKTDCDSNITTVEIDRAVWAFAINGNFTGRAHMLSTQSKYYLAHHHHVAGELTKAETVPWTTRGESCNELWDEFFLVLSV